MNALATRGVTCLFAIATALLPLAADAQSSARPTTRPSAARSALEDVIAKPADEAVFRGYLQTLPRVSLPGGVTRYVIESDLLFTEDEVRSLLARNLARTRALKSGLRPELIVNEVNGRPDFWLTVADRQLTYAIDRSTFSPSEFAVVEEAMMRATGDWVDACPECQLTFTHRADSDDRPDLASVTFVVRQVDARGSFIAAAFFPSSPVANRYVNIDPSFFTTDFDRAGVLRHELGHVIGYRHEHTRGVKGCYYEDAHWLPLTQYDPQSVMHYLCGNAGSIRLQLTPLDVVGHRQQYAVEPAPVPLPASTTLRPPSDVMITLRFEGADVSKNMFAALGVLAERGQLLTKEVIAREGDNPCALVRAALSLPRKIGCTDELVTRLWSAMNGGMKPGAIPAGKSVVVPAEVDLSTYQFGKTFDPGSESDRKRQGQLTANWGPWIVKQMQSNAAITRVVLEGYTLRTQLPSERDVPATLGALDKLRSENFYVETSGWSAPQKQKLHANAWGDYLVSCKITTPPPKADYAQLVSARKVAACEKTCTKCAEVMLVDTQVAQHPKLARALNLAQPPADAPSCNAVLWQESFHGTHLAGIVAATESPTGMVGLSPSSHLRPFVLPNGNVDGVVADYINQWTINSTDGTGSKIFLFASEFMVKGDIKTSQYSHPDHRFAESRSSKLIRDASDILLVVAAGQADEPGEERQTLYPTSKIYPMNLGDLANVIVVTACEDCDKSPTVLMASANVGTPVNDKQSLVHVVAPGGRPIPGLVNGNAADIALALGTSQAAAFAAGTAAAAANCFPGDFPTASKLKRRILVTSRPTLTEFDNSSVNSGVLDYELATRDPKQDWYRPNGTSNYESVKAGWWCSKELEYKQSWGEPAKIGTSRIRRVYKGPDNNGAATWFLYADDLRNRPMGLIKIGPVQILGDSKLIKLTGAPERVVGTDTIADILLADREIAVGACSGG